MTSQCVDNPNLALIGCGATYGGETQHSVARVTWSEHPDGRAHITATARNIEKCWQKGSGSAMADPNTAGLVQGADKRWRAPAADETPWRTGR